uniref:Dormancy associated MADS-box protein Truncated DAM3 n=1 Tax=Rhizophora mucronata TaxID=61149 RepID=A0A2P2M547_RHIMU
MRAISASERVESSLAFLKSPFLLLEKVTCLAVILSIFLILIFCLAIFLEFPQITN